MYRLIVSKPLETFKPLAIDKVLDFFFIQMELAFVYHSFQRNRNGSATTLTMTRKRITSTFKIEFVIPDQHSKY